MKYPKLIVMVVFLVASSIYSQTNFTENISSLWFAGQKTNVLSIATNRLAINSNDIAGLILKMEYEVEFLDFDNVTNTMQRVLTQGALITTTNFVGCYPDISNDIARLQYVLPLYPTNKIAGDRLKGNIPGKPFSYTKIIKALEDDGYFQ
ncbi:MAG: hypothetical protein PF692_03555 [Kiritimatiellae bacterium]|jgi:hypothetical protein|nr:hypothetical protein [Kiritimatiellia bacterium]